MQFLCWRCKKDTAQ